MNLENKERLITECIQALHIAEEKKDIPFATAFMSQEFLCQYRDIISDQIKGLDKTNKID